MRIAVLKKISFSFEAFLDSGEFNEKSSPALPFYGRKVSSSEFNLDHLLLVTSAKRQRCDASAPRTGPQAAPRLVSQPWMRP